MKARILDISGILTIVFTLVCFVIALFEKGLTHDLLLEVGVFLVSVKLILAAQKQKMDNERIEEKLDALLRRK